jgi:glucokinase
MPDLAASAQTVQRGGCPFCRHVAVKAKGKNMTDLNLVGDIGGTNSRFGLVAKGSKQVTHVEALKNDGFSGLEAAISQYLNNQGVTSLESAAVAVAAPVDREVIRLTNRDWSFSTSSLQKAANANHFRLLNDYEALALSLPHLAPEDLAQVGGTSPKPNALKVVLGPGTGLGMAMLAPLPGGGWHALPGEGGHVTLPVVTAEELALRDAMMGRGNFAEVEDVLTGPGLYALYKIIAGTPKFATSEDMLQAAIAGQDAAAEKTLQHFITFLARLSGDFAMALQAHGGVYLAGGIAPSIVQQLQSGSFRKTFDDHGRIAEVIHKIPVYVIVDKFPAFKGCVAALKS